MKYGVYAIRDVYTGFLTPTIEINDLVALRNFEHACSHTESLFYSHVRDYDLYRIGEYNTEDGALVPLVPVQLIANGASLKES